MPRIPYADPATHPNSVRASLARAPLNLSKMMAGASEAVFNGFNGMGGSFYGPAASLPGNLREIAILRVGYMSNAPYETYQHEPAGRQNGLDDNQIAALKHGGEHKDAFDAAQQSVVNFTEDVVKNVKASDATLAAVRTHLSDRQVLDLTLLIGFYMMVSRFLETTGVELDAHSLDWKTVLPQK